MEEQKARLTTIFQYVLELLDSANTVSGEPSVGYGRPSEKALTEHQERIRQILKSHLQELDKISKKSISRGMTQEILDNLWAGK